MREWIDDILCLEINGWLSMVQDNNKKKCSVFIYRGHNWWKQKICHSLEIAYQRNSTVDPFYAIAITKAISPRMLPILPMLYNVKIFSRHFLTMFPATEKLTHRFTNRDNGLIRKVWICSGRLPIVPRCSFIIQLFSPCMVFTPVSFSSFLERLTI